MRHRLRKALGLRFLNHLFMQIQAADVETQLQPQNPEKAKNVIR